MARLVFAALLAISLATPAALIVFDVPRLNDRNVPMLENNPHHLQREGPIAAARAEGYLAAARKLLRSADPADHARACRLIQRARRIRKDGAPTLDAACNSR